MITRTIDTRKTDKYWGDRPTEDFLSAFNMFADASAQVYSDISHRILNDNPLKVEEFMQELRCDQIAAHDPVDGSLRYRAKHVPDALVSVVHGMIRNYKLEEVRRIIQEKEKKNETYNGSDIYHKVMGSKTVLFMPHSLDTRITVLTEPHVGCSYDVLELKFDSNRNVHKGLYEFKTKNEAESKLFDIIKNL